MKKTIAFLLAVCLILSLAACGEQPPAAVTPEPAAVTPEPAAVTAAPLPLSPNAEANTAAFDAFCAQTLPLMLSDTGGNNRVFSPLNIYLALAALAESSAGQTQRQILDLMGLDDLDALHAAVRALWEANLREGGEGEAEENATIRLAASLWLRDGVECREEALRALEDWHRAAVFSGRMGSADYNRQLRDWINENTSHLLEKQAEGISLDADAVLALVTTLYFCAGWQDAFSESATRDGSFRAADGEKTVPFMHKTGSMPYYRGEHFAAVGLEMNGRNTMWILLPRGDAAAETLAADDEALRFLSSAAERRFCDHPRVRLCVPKFDLDSDLDLAAALAQLGLGDLFDPIAADLSRLSDLDGLCVSEIRHAARLKIDEKGCEAAAFTYSYMVTGALERPEVIIDFNCDHPFLFAVTGPEGQLLFTGAVNTVAES